MRAREPAVGSDIERRSAVQPALRSVAMPREHGGWGLTLEPVVLGLLIAPTGAGVALGAAAFVAFLIRTPLRIVLVDHNRQRRLPRTPVALNVVGAEGVILAGLVTTAAFTGDSRFWIPAALAAPLIVAELWFDMRSRSRRLVPELAGAIGISAVAPMIVLAGGEAAALAAGVWCVLAARSVTAIPHVRHQIAILHGRPSSVVGLRAADGLAIGIAGLGVIADRALIAGAVAVAVVVALQGLSDRRPIPAAKVIGIRQMALGLAVVAVTAAGVLT